MGEILRRLWSGPRKHAGEEELSRLADGELSPWHVRRLQRHLDQCWACRSRYEQLQGTIRHFVEYRKRIVAPHLPLRTSARDQFLRKLDEVSREAPAPWPAQVVRFLRSASAPMMNPIFATFLIVVAAAAAIFVVWQFNAPTVSASELLNRAQVWDTNAASQRRQGVIYQKVEIRTPTVTFDQSCYRDIEGRRRPRRADASLQQIALQKAFKSGGVDWQRPLSALDFRTWNEQLPEKKDEVFSDRRGTLTLRTRTNSSDVREESLTVRSSDFRPVARRLVFRDLGEIDISELNYEVLPWSAVNVAQLFELETAAPAPSALQPALRKPVPAVPTVAALDEAELRARLALSEIGADTGENISVERTGTSVAITGFVETQPRKREIDQALLGLPLVSTSVSTFELRNQQLAASDEAQPSHVTENAAVAQTSPLEAYLASRSVPQEQAVQMSRDLFDDALEIDRQSLALDALERRFPPAAQTALTAANLALFRQLFARHLSALNQALQKERELISAYVGELPEDTMTAGEGSAAADLLRSATENMRLSSELLTHSKDEQRSADVILKELAQSLQRCQRIATSLGRDT
jgi:hypothetical protein